MIAAQLLASIGIVLVPQTGAESPANLAEVLEDSITLSLRIEETELAAQSLTEVPLLLIFASEDQDMHTAFWLPPGARYEEEFPRGTLTGLVLEVLSVTDGGWTSTGSILLGDSLPLLTGGIWALDCGHALAQPNDEPLSAATPAGSTLPARFVMLTEQRENSTGEQSHGGDFHLSNLHVPVPTPTDKPKENKPPKLRPKPLPPV